MTMLYLDPMFLAGWSASPEPLLMAFQIVVALAQVARLVATFRLYVLGLD